MATIKTNYKPIPEEFREIAPYNDGDFKEKLDRLVAEPAFEKVVRYVMPNVDYPALLEQLKKVETQHEFQAYVMGQVLEALEKNTTDGISIDGLDNIDPDKSYTFLTNHRDIVLDASFLNLCFIRRGMPITQVAIGNNLLIYDWITDLVKINRSFIVKRDVKMAKALEAARQLSAYIHYTINVLKESVWIAQRQGRAKDSNDLTQDSVVKMLSLGGEGSVKESLMQVNLCPVSISYEYDPNDYLKAREYLMRRRDPQFKKSQHDDLFSMETGILGYKGRVKFRVGKCINEALAAFQSDSRPEIIREACRLLDNSIHSGYELFQCNYIAYDELEGADTFASHYTPEEKERFNAYIEGQLDKVDLPDVSPEERDYMRQLMLGMYANPLKNKLLADRQQG